MHLHGGRIGVHSRGEGTGTTFVIDIPIYRRELRSRSKSLSSTSFRQRVTSSSFTYSAES